MGVQEPPLFVNLICGMVYEFTNMWKFQHDSACKICVENQQRRRRPAVRMAAPPLRLTSTTVALLWRAAQPHVNTFYGWAPPPPDSPTHLLFQKQMREKLTIFSNWIHSTSPLLLSEQNMSEDAIICQSKYVTEIWLDCHLTSIQRLTVRV